MGDAWIFGPIMIKEKWAFYFIAGLVAYIVIRFGVYRKSIKRSVLELLWNALLLFAFVWKMSYTVLHPLNVLANPMSQLYFTGGDKGILFALGAVLIYFLRRSKKEKMPVRTYIEPGLIAMLAALGTYLFLLMLMDYSSPLYSLLQIFLSVILVVYWFRNVGRGHQPLWPGMILWFSLGELLISYFNDRIPVWLGFSFSQWVFIAISFIVIVVSYRGKRSFNKT
ncbi:hypothetical protein [Pseudalkalibacillus decolorationis]|uniref:hypothetical protein n=1 Tax=Pseudalkalibacillus decolorationis TaxID=163879 RepID=UPI002147578C|nr:hypothetical protein [Pseudalkalibacillus decolorationis]